MKLLRCNLPRYPSWAARRPLSCDLPSTVIVAGDGKWETTGLNFLNFSNIFNFFQTSSSPLSDVLHLADVDEQTVLEPQPPSSFRLTARRPLWVLSQPLAKSARIHPPRRHSILIKRPRRQQTVSRPRLVTAGVTQSPVTPRAPHRPEIITNRQWIIQPRHYPCLENKTITARADGQCAGRGALTNRAAAPLVCHRCVGSAAAPPLPRPIDLH